MKKQKTNRVLMLLITFLNVFAVFAESGKIPDPPEQVNSNSPCNLENLSFSSQAAIDAFGVTYSGCTEITLSGDLTIGFSNDITNLNGLSNLTSVGGNFHIEQASSLTNFVGLNNLTSIGGFLQIWENSNLINLEGLNNLTTVGGHFAISSNPNLISLDGLSNLTSINGELLSIYQNLSLTNLDGLSNLTSLGGDLSFEGNLSLTNLDGLSNLSSIGGALSITNHSNLTDISGLDNITGITTLLIFNNPMLSACNIASFCNYNSSALIFGNLPACNSLASIHASCVDCQPVTEVSAVPGATTAQISWTANSSETQWEIVWGTVGFDYENATPQTVSGAPEFSIENLVSGTTYEVHVKAVCNEFSESGWSEAHVFTTCPSGDYTFTTQAAIDNFGTTYSGCTDITLGNVLISGGDITNLNGLSQLSHVTGYFKIAGSSLQNLNGLNNLQSIEGFLEFFDNAPLQNLNGLNALISVGDYLNIYGNSALTNTEALSSLTHIGTYLTIYNNHQLTNINGLSSVQHLSGYLYVGYNAVLQNLSGLSNLQTVGSLNIVSNPALSNIGLNALQTTGPLDINSNPALTNLDGLSGLQNVLGHLKITNNATLSDISGLENIVQITGGIDGLHIINNPMLAACDIPSFCSYNLYSDISGNLPACNSLTNIHASCVDCQAVTEVSAVPEATTAQISWTANNIETQWEIVWGTVGFDYENATPQIVSETPGFTIENLISGTAYEVYVKAICNEFSESEWSVVSNFTTLCPSGDYTFTTQIEIDAFGVTYSGCTDIILGHVVISGSDIANLNGLSNLKTTGSLEIQSNPALTNLDGLSGLQNVLGHLKIINNATLSDISGLENIVQITGGMDGLHIINNPMLAACDVPPFCSYNLYSDISGNLPSCNSLANIHASCVDCQSVTEVTAVPGATTAQISWTANSSETQWEIVWGTVGFDYENATPQTVSGTPGFTIENLIQGTTYEVYLKAVCNEFSESGWSEAHVFTICPSGDYTFTTQAEIDAFGVTYSGCTDIVLGNLTISGGEINDLNGLSGIVTVTGNLTINHTSLVNLQGLNNLESVGGIFAFHDNGLFDDFTGLNNLESIGMGFPVYGNGNVSGTFEDFNGLDSLVSIGEGFYIAYNHHLKNFEGLTQLNSIGGALYIQYNENPGFVNLQGLESLQTISQDVVVEHQHQLQSLQGLDGLTTIGRDLNIRSCQGLQQFNGLNALESIARDCNIHLNGALQNINGLNGLQTINGSLNIYSNGGLQTINGFNGMQTINGNLNIYSNQTLQTLNGLNSLETINGFLSIYNHVTLQQLDGLEELSSVGSFVNIITNPQLQNLNGLANLTSIGGVLTINNNNALTDISGLENITVFGTGLTITNNSNLSVCDLPNFCTYLSDVSNPRNISGNAGDCVSNAMVLTICSDSTCLSPTYLSHTQLNMTSAELSWTSTGSLFDLEWGTQGFTQGSGTVVTDIATTIYQVTGLTSNLVYEFYVRQNCGADGESFWEGPYSFSVGYCSSVPTSNDSNGITNVSLGSVNFPVTDVTYYYYTGSIIDIQAGTNVVSAVTFATGFTYDTNIWIDLNDDGIFDSSELVFDGMSTNANPTTLNTSFYLDALANLGQHKMRIGTADLGQAIPNPCYSGAWGVTVDLMVNVTAAPFCIAPLELSHTQLSTTSAELSWISTGSLFNIEWGLQGFVKGTGTVISGISAPFYQLTGLTEHTVYEFYVRQDCGADEDIIWSDPYSFSVGYCIPVATAPASLDFDIYIHSVITTGGATNINNTGSGYSVNGFGNFSATHFASQYQGQSLSFSVAKSVGSSNNSVGIRIWLDWNDDGVFADSEIIYTSPTNHAGTHSGSFQIPSNQPVGNYRMRVVMIFNPTNLNSCDNTNQLFNYGEVEDYTLTVLADLSGNCESFTIWNGTSWSNGAPDTIKKAIIEGDLTLTTDLTACEVLLNSGILTVSSGATLTVNGMIENTQSAENFIVESGANLIQVEDVDNIGSITVERESSPMFRLDYTLWSSPVEGMKLIDFSDVSPTAGYGTLWNRVYTLGENLWSPVWATQPDFDNDNLTFAQAKGYLYRAKNDWVVRGSGNPAESDLGIFTGIPNNGNISINTPLVFNAIGNPYPSAVDADEVLTNGASALYFWTNTNVPVGGNYTSNNWATYSLGMGGVSADGIKIPDGIIQTGQGFVIGFESANPGRQVTFDNTMRLPTHNGQFFKQMVSERHRYWLNLSDEAVIYNQILVGYIENATQGIDTGIDAKMFAYEGNAIYSLIENSQEKYVIQGRELPFEGNDVVPIGLRVVNAGSFSISLSNFDGIFEEGNTSIYLQDNFNQTQHNLNEGAYEFVSEEGVFDNRFEVVYQTTMSVENPELSNADWIAFKQDNGFRIQTQGFELKEVSVYDMLGRRIYSSSAEGTTHQIPALGAEGVFIVKVTSTEDKVLNKKVR